MTAHVVDQTVTDECFNKSPTCLQYSKAELFKTYSLIQGDERGEEKQKQKQRHTGRERYETERRENLLPA